ncbi:MAG: hypothetical protein Q7S57_05920 [bacterium]|nr:hypothetical protein [bacterium]
MRERVSEAQDHAFYRVGSLGLVAVVFATILVVFAWLMQKPIENQTGSAVVEKNGVNRVEVGK